MMLKNSREVEMRCWKAGVGLQEMLGRMRRRWVGKVILAKGGVGRVVRGLLESMRMAEQDMLAKKKRGVWKRNAAGEGVHDKNTQADLTREVLVLSKALHN